MSPFIHYLELHKKEIQTYSQEPFYWRAHYQNSAVMSFPEFREALAVLPEPISRVDVIGLFQNEDDDFFVPFIAAMVWGGINVTRPMRGHQGDYTTTDFYMALSEGRDILVRKINIIRCSMMQGTYSAARCMTLDNTRIRGLGMSFYSKLLYFLSFSIESCAPRPLIYDRWGRYMHAALLLDMGCDHFLKYYTNRFNDRGNAIERYMNYVGLMAKTSHYLDLDDSGRLEAYLFGKSLTCVANRTMDNPRFVMKTYVDNILGLNRNY